MFDYDVIIVGSGAGGLCAAAALAKAGARVQILEAMPDFGGYLNPFRRAEYSFDCGMHYLGQLAEGGVFRALLRRIGLLDRVSFNAIEPEGFIRLVCGDLEFRFPSGPANVEERLAERFPEEARNIRRFLRTVVRIDRAVEAAAAMGLGARAWLRALPRLPRLLSVLPRTYFELVASHTSNPQLQAMLCLMNGWLPAKRAAALVPALIFRHYLDGAYYPRGGSGALRDALVGAIRDGGNGLENDTRVLRIRRQGTGFIVHSKDREWRTRSVICDADPTALYTSLLDSSLVPEKLRRKASAMVPSYGAFYAYLATELDLRSMGLSSATIQHYDSIDIMLGEDWRHWDKFEQFLLSCTTLKDPGGGHAPPRQHVIELVAPAPFAPFAAWASRTSMQRGDEYLSFKAELGRRLIKKAERYIPGLSSNLCYVDFATPVTNSYWVNAPSGGCYGPAHLPSQVGRGRFAIKSHVPGLFLCGHGTLAGGIYPSMRSGEIAAAFALRHLGKNKTSTMAGAG